MKQKIKVFLFGERIKGQPIKPKTQIKVLSTVNPDKVPTFNEWMQFVYNQK